MSGFIGPLLGLGGDIAGGILGSRAAGNAAKQQQQAVQEALGAQRQNLATTTENVQPWVQSGQNALNALQQLLGIGTGLAGANNPILQMLGLGPGGTGVINPGMFHGSPGYQFALGQGEQAAEQAGARTGQGGNTLKALTQYATGYADQDFYNYLNSLSNAYQNLVGNVSGLSSTGLQAGETLGQIGAGTANSISDLFTQGGNAAAAGTIGGTNALVGGITGGLSNLITQGAGPNNLFGALQQLISGNNQFQFTPGQNTASFPGGWGVTPNIFNATPGVFNPTGA